MIRKFQIDPSLKPYLHDNWHNEIIISRMGEFNEENTLKLINEVSLAHLSNQKETIIVIDSLGGSVSSLSSIISNIEMSSKPVVTVVQGKAMSCGCFLAGFGTVGRRYAAPDSVLMFHNLYGGTTGNASDLKQYSSFLDNQLKYWCEKLAIHCGHSSKSYFLDLLKEYENSDIYMTPKQAKKHKLIDHIKLPSIEATIEFKVEIL